MKIKIKLDESKYCDGCPYLKIDWDKATISCEQLIYQNKIIRWIVIRTQECIDKFGE